MLKLALLTCQELPQGTLDDRLLIEPLKRLGVETTFIDWRHKEQIQKTLEQNTPVLIRSPWDYIEDLPGFLDCCDQFSKLYNPSELVRWNSHKSYLWEFEKLGLPIIPMTPLEDFKEDFQEHIEKSLEEDFDKRFVVKPYVSASSFETVVIQGRPSSQVRRWQEDHPENYFVQPYCDSIETMGEYSLIFFNERERGPTFSHATRKLPRKGDFRVQEEFGGTTQEVEVEKEMVSHAQNYCQVLDGGEWLYARVDLVSYNQSWCLSELELIEPDLYLRTCDAAAARLSEVILRNLTE